MPEPLPLDYDSHPKPKHWKFAAVVFALAFAFALVLLAPMVWKRASPWWNQAVLLYQQHCMMNLAAPADQVMYEDDPAGFPALLHQSGAYRIEKWPGELNSVKYWWELSRDRLPQEQFGFFVHERTPTNGQHRIVNMVLISGFGFAPMLPNAYDNNMTIDMIIPLTQPDERLMPFMYSVYTPATWELASKPAKTMADPLFLTLKKTDHFRVYAGQPDPKDLRRFTFRYALNDQPGNMEGWLTSNDDVQLHIIDGPATTRPTNGFVTTAPAE